MTSAESDNNEDLPNNVASYSADRYSMNDSETVKAMPSKPVAAECQMHRSAASEFLHLNDPRNYKFLPP